MKGIMKYLLIISMLCGIGGLQAANPSGNNSDAFSLYVGSENRGWTMTVKPSDIVGAVKGKIRDHFDLSADQQVSFIIFKSSNETGSLDDDTKTLMDYGINGDPEMSIALVIPRSESDEIWAETQRNIDRWVREMEYNVKKLKSATKEDYKNKFELLSNALVANDMAKEFLAKQPLEGEMLKHFQDWTDTLRTEFETFKSDIESNKKVRETLRDSLNKDLREALDMIRPMGKKVFKNEDLGLSKDTDLIVVLKILNLYRDLFLQGLGKSKWPKNFFNTYMKIIGEAKMRGIDTDNIPPFEV